MSLMKSPIQEVTLKKFPNNFVFCLSLNGAIKVMSFATLSQNQMITESFLAISVGQLRRIESKICIPAGSRSG